MALPLAVIGSGYYYISTKMSQYPPEAKKHLRKALLAHDYGFGNILAAPVEYKHAYSETVKVLPKYSPESTGILEKLIDLYQEMKMDKEYEDTMHLLFDNLTGDEVVKENRIKPGLKVAQKLADHSAAKNKNHEAAFYYQWIIENSVIASASLDKDIVYQPLTLRPWATVRQVGTAFEQMGSIYSAKNMFEYSLIAYTRALELLNKDNLAANELSLRSATLHNNMGECFSKLNKLKDAERFIQIAINEAPINQNVSVIARYNMGMYSNN